MIEELRKGIAGEEFDYQALLDGLREYERPRDKITSLLRQGAIILVKKGIYVFGERYARRPYSREFLLRPIPFSVRAFVLPNLFAGKMHAVLCRQWKSRNKGRDWYDLVWYAAYHPQLHLSHLEKRMIQSGHLKEGEHLTRKKFLALSTKAIEKLNVEQARREVEPFVKNPEALEVWSKDFFQDVAGRIVLI
ncbi:MAG: nucleotidyl transferase AbiEii/AbiGii toxin family protein [Deltaproteobacteria bacterium]|nr:nucleotidyl transferase AbiEii/AbiGii toxin family protein [Deltaproteobacteria bacterium]